MSDIEVKATTPEGQLQEALAEWAEEKAQPVIDEINADLAALPTADNAAVKTIIEHILIHQRKIINGIVKLVKRNGL